MPACHLQLPRVLACSALVGLLPTVGCDDAGRDPDAWADQDDDVDSDAGPTSSPIKDGVSDGLQQTVRISTNGGICTGVLLNPHTVLTAAHCVGPIAGLQSGLVSNGTTSSTIDRARVWTYDSNYDHNNTGPGEIYDVAVFATNTAFALDTDLAPTYALIGSTRPADNDALWVNGRMNNGVDSGGIMSRATVLDPLLPSDARYPFQLLDIENSPIDVGDSGGPLFRERPGELNDGKGGSIAPVIYGVVSRGGSYARLDPIKSWIDTRAEEIQRSFDWHEGDYSWTRCDRDSCPVYMSTEIDGAWLPLGEVPRNTRMGVFVQSGDAMVVSYPMDDRGRKVQLVSRTDGFVNDGFADHGAPPTEDLRIEDRYCASGSCTVYSKRNLQDSDVTAVGAVSCGTRMGVFVKSQDWVVVSYPMNDRGRAVQVVPRGGSSWSTSAPAC